MSDYAGKAIGRWQSENIQLGAGLDDAALKIAFESINWCPSTDVLKFYGRCSGMLPSGTDDSSFFSLWPFPEALGRSAEISKPYFSFGDGFLSAHRYSFRVTTTGQSGIYGDYFDENFTKLAESVEDFFECLLTRPKKLWLP